LRRADGIDDFLYAGFLIANDTKDLEPQRMRDRLQRARRLFDVFLLVDETTLYRHDD
jgi:hypothetical protein